MPPAGLEPQDWLNAIALTGIACYVFAHVCVYRGWCAEGALWNRALKLVSAGFVLTPLYGFWYLSEKHIAAVAVLLVMMSGWAVWHRQK